MQKLRKHVGQDWQRRPDVEERGISVPETAVVLVSSESADHPIDHAFDGKGGPGGTQWRASVAGDQTILVAFGAPQTIRRIVLEVEERAVSRRQELSLGISHDNGHTYRDVVCQEYNFDPSGTTFEHEEWTLATQPITHVRLRLKPDKHKAEIATLTTLQFQ